MMQIGTVFWIVNLIYALIYWGFWWGILNIVIPFAIIWDLVGMLGRFGQ